MTTRPLLSLVMILKDEASNIRTTLDSCLGAVDCVTILDTGSTDGTQGVVSAWFESNKVHGHLFEEAFIDFAASRNRALEVDAFVHGAEFQIMLSGDEVLKGGESLREFLSAQKEGWDGAYCVQLTSGPQAWLYPRVTRTDIGWKYVGEVHEVPVGPRGERSGPTVPEVQVIHTVSDPSRRAKRAREFDLPKLTSIVEDAKRPLVERAQAMFHLAEVYNVLAAERAEADKGAHNPEGPWLTHQMTAMSLYMRYALIAEESEEAKDTEKAMFAYFRYFNTAEKIGLFTHEELVGRLTVLAEGAPRIPEIRYMLAVHAAQLDARQGLFLAQEAARVAREAREKPIHLPTDVRMEWMALRVAAECAKHLKKPDQAKALAKRAVDAGGPAKAFEGIL